MITKSMLRTIRISKSVKYHYHQNKDDLFKESLLYRKINQFSFELKKLFYKMSNITKNLNK